MNNNLQTVHMYHQETKHFAHKYARSLGYMDWETQPNPYRSYEGTKKTPLPLAFNQVTPSYIDIFTTNKKKENIKELNLENISAFFQFSLGLAAIKEYGSQSWALRCNASSGNLQPSEAYIIAQDIEGIDDGLHHYAPKEHHLERISFAKSDLSLPSNTFVVLLSSIVWREAWKYGERAWRYTQLDCGHALKALEVSALMLGWEIDFIPSCDKDLNNLLGFDQKERFIKEEREVADMLLLVRLSDKSKNNTLDIKNLQNALTMDYEGQVNCLSASWHEWDILEKIEDASVNNELHNKENVLFKYENTLLREKTYESKDIVLLRRSAQVMDEHDSNISKSDFETILASVKAKNASVHLAIFVHDVQGYESGLYLLLRNTSHKDKLQMLCKSEFLWQEIKTEAGNLYLLQKGDFKAKAKLISCNQDIAAHSAFSLGMLVEFSSQLLEHGESRYKQLYWECGALGQQLYLETTSLNLSATGIGCFLDDLMHETLGLKGDSFQSLYHFTIGKGLIDERLSTLKPYQNQIN